MTEPIREEELVLQIEQLSVQRLHRWIRLGWVRPDRVEGLPFYYPADVARVRLLHDMETAAEFDEETVPLILSLLDQIHELKHQLRLLAIAIDAQPGEIRLQIRSMFQRLSESA